VTKPRPSWVLIDKDFYRGKITEMTEGKLPPTLMEKRFPEFTECLEQDLKATVLTTYNCLTDGNEEMEKRLEALQNYLAAQYFLYDVRLKQARDREESRMILELMGRFSGVFVGDMVDANLYRFCEDNAYYYGGLEMTREAKIWFDLKNGVWQRFCRRR
jgi:hypothetical protein